MVFVITLAISPTARTATLAQNIGELIFQTTDKMDDPNVPQGRNSYDLIMSGPLDETSFSMIPTESGSLEDAQDRLGYAFGIPTFAPEDFEFDHQISYTASEHSITSPSAQVRWRNSQGVVIDMNVLYPAQTDLQHVVGRGSIEEVQINGQPAALQHGLWNPDTEEWEQTSLAILRWLCDCPTISSQIAPYKIISVVYSRRFIQRVLQ